MAVKFFILFLFIISVAAILVLYALKMAYNFLYLRLRDKKKPGAIGDFFTRNFIHKGDDMRWQKAFFALPLMFGIVLEDESQPIQDIKRIIKRLHMAIYSVLIVAMLLAIYASKAYPEGLF